MKIVTAYRKIMGSVFRKNVVRKMRKRNRLKKATILCSNCIGGLLLHDLGLRFDSPTVNLFFTAHDFVSFISNLNYYLSLPLSSFRLSKND